jgi:hypothetical protein
MKIHEIILEADEHASASKLHKDQVAALKGAVSLPSISHNTSNGSPYQGYRFGLALAVADGKHGGQMPATGAFAGDPLMLVYADHELDMIKDAAEMSNATPLNIMSDMRSHESDEVHRVSPVRDRGAVQYKRKK